MQNIEIYKDIIEYETKKSIEISNDTILIDNKPITKYKFSSNYYFLSGDYVVDSYDSRYWGLLPEDHIIGKASFIWKSKNISTNKYILKRFFHSID